MVFPWSLSDSKSSRVSRTLLSILIDLNNAVIWTISNASIPLSKPLGSIPSASIIISVTVTFPLHRFLSTLASLSFCFFLVFTLWSVGTKNSTVTASFLFFFFFFFFFFFLIHLSLGLVFWPDFGD